MHTLAQGEQLGVVQGGVDKTVFFFQPDALYARAAQGQPQQNRTATAAQIRNGKIAARRVLLNMLRGKSCQQERIGAKAQAPRRLQQTTGKVRPGALAVTVAEGYVCVHGCFCYNSAPSQLKRPSRRNAGKDEGGFSSNCTKKLYPAARNSCFLEFRSRGQPGYIQWLPP